MLELAGDPTNCPHHAPASSNVTGGRIGVTDRKYRSNA